MKKHLAALLLAASLASPLCAAEQILVEAKIVETKNSGVIPRDFQRLAKIKGVEILSAPQLIANSGQEATIEVIRAVSLPGRHAEEGQRAPVGVTVLVKPALREESIAYTAKLTLSNVVKMRSQAAQNTTEIVSRDLYVSGTPKNGQPVWFEFATPRDGKRILVCLTFTRVIQATPAERAEEPSVNLNSLPF